jgi:hypothetical protein
MLASSELDEHFARRLKYLTEHFTVTGGLIHHHHRHMALQPNSGPCLHSWGFVTITFLQG